MNKKIILLSVLAIVSIVALSQTVYAATSTLSVVPGTSTKNVGTAFNASINLNPQGEKVCVVTGTLTFNNLTCRSITVGSGLMAQTSPTCANPKFVLGIPSCASAAQNILTVSVKGNAVGQAGLSFTGVKVIGAGTDVAFTFNGGAYNIIAVPKSATTTTPATGTTTTPATEITTTTTPATENSLPANAGTASFLSVALHYFWPLLIVLIIACIGYGIYYFVKSRKETKDSNNMQDNNRQI